MPKNKRHLYRIRRLLAVFVGALILISLTQTSPVRAAVPSAIQGLHVEGNIIANGSHQLVRMLGINRSGSEYLCAQNRGIWDGPVDNASIEAMLAWHINTVRIPLNEDCWLEINGVSQVFGGSIYQQAIIKYVNALNSYGIIVILDLHWNAPGSMLADKQLPMPDTDHSPAFWQSVAKTFKDNSSVIFDLFNEPTPDNKQDTTAGWICWRDGKCPDLDFEAAGMQSLVTTIRETGATNVIMLGGLSYANALTRWLTYMPDDPLGNLVAAWHSYNFNLCSNSFCWASRLIPVMQQVPLVVGEIGENDCAHGYIDKLMDWLDSYNVSYLAWTWDTWAGACASGPTLIKDYQGTPTAFGQGFKDHLAKLAQNQSAAVTSGATAKP